MIFTIENVFLSMLLLVMLGQCCFFVSQLIVIGTYKIVNRRIYPEDIMLAILIFTLGGAISLIPLVGGGLVVATYADAEKERKWFFSNVLTKWQETIIYIPLVLTILVFFI